MWPYIYNRAPTFSMSSINRTGDSPARWCQIDQTYSEKYWMVHRYRRAQRKYRIRRIYMLHVLGQLRSSIQVREDLPHAGPGDAASRVGNLYACKAWRLPCGHYHLNRAFLFVQYVHIYIHNMYIRIYPYI